MTRVKKTRSMKRIHSTKTGSKSKLKKELATDRQGRKDHHGKRTLSAYEKFLQDNPDAAKTARLEQMKQQQQAEAQKLKPQATTEPAPTKIKEERKKDLLDQLDEKHIKDMF